MGNKPHKPQREELTTAMHHEFLKGEVSENDFKIASIFGAINQGVSKEEACMTHGISVAEYDANIERVLADDSW